MTFYLPNTDVLPTGFEPAEFIDPDLPPRAADAVAERLSIIAPQVNGPLSTEGPVGLTRPDGSAPMLTDDQEITDVIIRAAKETR